MFVASYGSRSEVRIRRSDRGWARGDLGLLLQRGLAGLRRRVAQRRAACGRVRGAHLAVRPPLLVLAHHLRIIMPRGASESQW